MSPHRLLLVDQDPTALATLEAALPNDRWTIEVAPDPHQAVDCVRRTGYDLVLIDLGAPEDGIPLLRRMREIRPGTKVVLTATEISPEHVVSALCERAFSMIRKPFPVNTVIDVASEAVETRAWEDDVEVLSAKPQWVILRVRCKIETAERLVHFLREMDAGLDPEDRDDICCAFRELVMNAVEHGGNSDPDKFLRISTVRARRSVIYYIQDPGPGFNVSELEHAAVNNPDDEPVRHTEIRTELGVRPGGFGIMLTQNLVDELIYNEKGNEVLFVKYLNDRK